MFWKELLNRITKEEQSNDEKEVTLKFAMKDILQNTMSNKNNINYGSCILQEHSPLCNGTLLEEVRKKNNKQEQSNDNALSMWKDTTDECTMKQNYTTHKLITKCVPSTLNQVLIKSNVWNELSIACQKDYIDYLQSLITSFSSYQPSNSPQHFNTINKGSKLLSANYV